MSDVLGIYYGLLELWVMPLLALLACIVLADVAILMVANLPRLRCAAVATAERREGLRTIVRQLDWAATVGPVSGILLTVVGLAGVFASFAGDGGQLALDRIDLVLGSTALGLGVKLLCLLAPRDTMWARIENAADQASRSAASLVRTP